MAAIRPDNDGVELVVGYSIGLTTGLVCAVARRCELLTGSLVVIDGGEKVKQAPGTWLTLRDALKRS